MTGVDGRLLRQGMSVPVSQAADGYLYTKEDFERYQQTEWRSTKAAQGERLTQCRDALELLFRAAMQPGGDPPRSRLPAFLDSFMQWCERAREDFKLGPEVEAQLARRRFRPGLTQAYRDWRAMAREDAEALKAAGFKNHPKRGDEEQLRLEPELMPGWAPGRSMKAPKPAVMVAVPRLAVRGGTPETKASETRCGGIRLLGRSGRPGGARQRQSRDSAFLRRRLQRWRNSFRRSF